MTDLMRPRQRAGIVTTVAALGALLLALAAGTSSQGLATAAARAGQNDNADFAASLAPGPPPGPFGCGPTSGWPTPDPSATPCTRPTPPATPTGGWPTPDPSATPCVWPTPSGTPTDVPPTPDPSATPCADPMGGPGSMGGPGQFGPGQPGSGQSGQSFPPPPMMPGARPTFSGMPPPTPTGGWPTPDASSTPRFGPGSGGPGRGFGAGGPGDHGPGPGGPPPRMP